MSAEPLDVHARVLRLERSLNRWRRTVACVAMVALGSTLVAWRQGESTAPANADDSVRGEFAAKRFRLVDDDGRSRAALDFDARGEPRFALYDAAGKPRIRLRLRGVEAFVDLLDERGRHRLGLAVDTASLPQVLLLDEAERPRYQLAMNEKGAPGMMFLADDSTICSGQGIDAKGEPWRIDKPLRAESEPATTPKARKDANR